jgi:hypothetical protein
LENIGVYLFVQGSRRRIVLTQLQRRLKPKAADWDIVFAREGYPLRACVDIGIRVV